jgi:hypothetical protein
MRCDRRSDRIGRRHVLFCHLPLSEHRMDIDEEIMARIRAAKVWDKDSKLEDFQIKAAENGFVLINLKTGRAQLIYDENSELTDLEKLFPNELLKGLREQ